MMRIEITHKELESILLNETHSEFQERCKNFLVNPKEDYYCYGYIPLDAQFLEISMEQLKEIRSHNTSQFDIINAVYQAGKITGQSSVYLYGRDRA